MRDLLNSNKVNCFNNSSEKRGLTCIWYGFKKVYVIDEHTEGRRRKKVRKRDACKTGHPMLRYENKTRLAGAETCGAMTCFSSILDDFACLFLCIEMETTAVMSFDVLD